MPFSPATFADWPFDFARLRPHYQAMLGTIPFAAEEDALAAQFPLLAPAQPLPALAPRTEAVLRRAERRQADLERHGMVVGRARLAFEANSCVRCGLCMTGCPYRLIYSAAQTIDRLRAAGRVRYHEGLLALAIGQEGTTPFVVVRDLRSGKTERIVADRLYVGCGAVGTTRLVLDSLRLYEQDVTMAESAQFVLPMLSRVPVPDPRQDASFTLNQFNLVVSTGGSDRDVSQIHFYPYSDAVAEALPALLKTRAATTVATALLRRLTIGLGYLPSWESPVMQVRLRASRRSGVPSGLDVSGDEQPALANHMFRDVMQRMVRAAPMLDLWPVVPQAFLSAPGKSYHFGGSLPHRRSAVDGPLTTDTHGRLRCWPAVHFVDASVFPTVPATTFTLTIMANAHRIARESLALTVHETVAA
jgi:choline dehydrogenase-like flavoprotein